MQYVINMTNPGSFPKIGFCIFILLNKMCLELSIDIINDLAHTNPKQWNFLVNFAIWIYTSVIFKTKEVYWQEQKNFIRYLELLYHNRIQIAQWKYNVTAWV